MFVSMIEVRISDVIYNIPVLYAHTSSTFHIVILIKSFLMCCDVIQFYPDNII